MLRCLEQNVSTRRNFIGLKMIDYLPFINYYLKFLSRTASLQFLRSTSEVFFFIDIILGNANDSLTSLFFLTESKFTLIFLNYIISST